MIIAVDLKLHVRLDFFIENIHTPFQVQGYIWDDNLDGEASLQCYLQCVDDCAEFEIPTVVVHLPDDDKPYNDLGVERIKKIAQRAEYFGVNVALENLYNINNLNYVLEQVNSPRVGFVITAVTILDIIPIMIFLQSIVQD